MATQNINIGVNVSDNGTAKKVVKSFQEIEAAATKAQTAANNIADPTGGTPGSRKVSAKYAPAGSPEMSGQQYGQMRGSAGATGASARDFANQAQGLGGLVRLYATYAANLFAVGAAFTALKSAADTTNLVKGLNTLGAASGQSLGSLSKRLVEVTDGAVSMREAMEATAKASSAGMSSKDIERLGLVAKNASLALGVAMPDALSRISRGIVKLEPELLDELGLFTKIGPATEKYALEIGKSASSLTDFERRQAFANAVLAEGEKKFGALAEAAANPYDKLLSSLKNILSSGGELINKVLTPIISLLANSPTALVAVLTSIGYVLLKQAIPAIGQLRAGLRNTAEEALKSAEAFKESFGDEFQSILERRFKIPDLEAGVKKAEADLAKINVPSKIAGSVTKLAEGDVASLKNVKDVLARKNALLEASAAGTKKVSDAQVAAAKQEILYINAVINLLQKKQALEQGTKAEQTEADKPIGPLDPEVLALQKYQKLRGKVDQANAISNAAQTAGIAGVRASWELLNKEVAEKNITGFSKYSTLAQGGLAAIGTRVMGIIGNLGNLGLVISVVTGTFALLDSIFTKNAKQAETFNKALTSSEESVANVNRTLQAATTAEGFGSKTIANTVALSNAFNELTTSAKEALKTEKAAAEAASGWDKFWNGVFTIAGKDRSSKLADSIAKQISSSIDLLSREGLADEYASEIKKILNVTNLKDIGSVARAWKNLSKDQQASVLAIQENSNRALGNASAALQGFKEKTDSALTAYKTFTNSFIDTSPLFKLGEAYIDIGQSLAEVAAAGPNRIAQAFEELANNSQKAALFGEKFVNVFAPMAEDFKKQKAALDALNISLEKQVEARKNLSSASRVLTTEGGAAIVGPNMGRRTRQDSETANENIRLTNRAIAAIRTELVEKGTKVLVDAGKQAIDTGLALINRSIANARTTADINISKVLSSVLTGPRKLEAENEIRQRELKLQLEDVKISETLINIQSSLVDEMKLANALQAEANALQKGDQSAIERTARDAQKARAAVGQKEGIDPDILAAVAKDQELNKQRTIKGLQSKKIAITEEMRASTLSTQLQMPGATLQQQEQLAKITDRKLAAERASLDVNTAIAGVTSTTGILIKQAAEASAAKRAQDSEIAAINADIEKTELARAEAKGTEKARYTEELTVLEKIKTETEAAQKAESDTTGIKNRQELLSQELRDIDKRLEAEKLIREVSQSRLDAQLDIKEAEFNAYSALLGYSEKYINNVKLAFELQKSQAAFVKTSAEANAVYDAQKAKTRQQLETIDASLGGDIAGPGAQANIDAIIAEDERARAARDAAITQAEILLGKNTQIANIINKAGNEQARFNELLATTTSFAESLKSVFGDMGEKLGAVATTFAEVAVSSEKRAKSEAKLAKDLADARKSNDPLEIAAAEETLTDQKKKNAKAELTDNIKLVSSTKNLFKEKTGAYKILAGIEKVMHITKLAMDAKELAVKLSSLATGTAAKAGSEAADTGLTFAGTIGRLPAYAAEIYGKTIGQLGPIAGPVVATALVAAMFSMFGKGGGGKAAFVPNAEQRQETQGTAMGYNSEGAKVQVRRGVFGDTEAKSESIANSLELIRETSVDGLSYDNKMVTLLTSINSGINKTAKNLYGISGLRTGSMFGTVEGSSGGGFLRSKTSRSISDSGLIIEGTFAQLASDTNKSVLDFFEQVTVSKRNWYGRKTTWIETYRKEVDDATSEFFQGVFGDATSLFLEVGKLADISEEQINSILEGMDLSNAFISLRGLKGADFEKELSAVISAILDDASSVIFSSFESYAKFGEGMTETVIRVIDTNTKINQATKNLGLTADLTKLFSITEALSTAAGGLDKFLEQAEYFRENFLTEAERLAPVQKAVVKQLAALGFASVDTKAEFKALVQSLDLTDSNAQKTYQSLMDLAPGFNEVIEAADSGLETIRNNLEDTIASFTDFAKNIKSFREGLIFTSNSLATPFEKYAAAKLQFESVYTKALGGDKDAMGKLTSASQTFLDASKTMYASSDTYATDYATVLERLDYAGISAQASVDVAQLQLNATNTQVSILQSIDGNIANLSGGTSANIGSYATGGYASGLSIVGERGPELVDFTSPGQVYTADQTRGMFTGGNNMTSTFNAMVNEIQQLCQEVAALRKDQQKQTGDIIISNYDANQKASEEIATAVVSTSQDMTWTNRSKSEIK